jgi:PAS domain S-box-containing protein
MRKHDITYWKNWLKRLERNRFPLPSEGMMILDLDEMWFLVNGALIKMLGYKPAEFRSVARRQDMTFLTRCFASGPIWEDVCKTGLLINHETEFVRKNGERITTLVNGAAIEKRLNGKHVVALSIADVTEHENMVERLRRSNTQLLSRLRALEKRLEITARELEASQKIVQESSRCLENSSEVTRLVMTHTEQHKRDLRQRIADNVDLLIRPLIVHIKSTSLTKAQDRLLESLEFNIQHLTSGLGISVTQGLRRLTPRETQICRMIGEGKDSREIADALGVKYLTILTQRKNIRKRLGLSKKKQNLASFIRQYM